MEAERCDLAATFIDEALVKFPNQQQVLYTCARCLLRVGDNQRVQQIIERLENTSPDLAIQLKTLLRL
jgi:predicted Zn-dependent protease